MSAVKHDILKQLEKDLLPLLGFKSQAGSVVSRLGFSPIASAFPNAVFPTGAVHELLTENAEQLAATTGFITAILGKLMTLCGVSVFIGKGRKLFPPALKAYGVDPERIIFIDVKNESDLIWATEEALKCTKLTAVVAEIKDISFTASRRLQLAVEQSKVTGFILRHQAKSLNTIACVARWKITPVKSEAEAGLPGVGFPCWNVDLQKVRNGKPASWKIGWHQGNMQLLTENKPIAKVYEGLRQVV